MSYSDWLPELALRRILIAVASLYVLAYHIGVSNRAEEAGNNKCGQQTQNQQGPPQGIALAAIQKNEITDAARNGDENTRNYKQLDLEAQQSMADSTKEMSNLSWWQFIASVIGIVLLFATLLWTRKATVAAIEAANAGSIQAKAAVRSMIPYVHLTEIEMNPLGRSPGEGNAIYCPTFTYTNYGTTPAFVTKVGWGLEPCEKPPTIPEYRYTDRLTSEAIIKPGESHTFSTGPALFVITDEQQAIIKKGNGISWLWFMIQYKDFMDGITERGTIACYYQKEVLGGEVVTPEEFSLKMGPAEYTYENYYEPGEEPKY